MSAAPRAVAPSVNSWNAAYLESQYERYRSDPTSVSEDLRSFFQGFDLARSGPSGAGSALGDTPGSGELVDALRVQHSAAELIEAYRRLGHRAAALDPFGRSRPRPASLDPAYHGLTEADLDKPVRNGIGTLPETASIRETIAFLEATYCRTTGVQFMHIAAEEERNWLTERFERDATRQILTRGERAHILEQLVRAEQFETFLQKRYAGEKRFSLEGGESLIPLLDRVIEASANSGVEELVMGMPHRGRLNVLNNTLGKSYEQIFTEFEDNWEEDFVDGGGDVKYHRGYSGERSLRSGRSIHLTMASNPSHLESVNGVVLGRCRAKQRLWADNERRRVVPLLLHGDGAVIGQGVVMEILNLSQLEGYACGGCIHVVVNNLIGFTTGPEDARSSTYCTDIALMIDAPVFHVNAEDPEAVVRVAQLAVEYRQKFRKDVVIDMWCYRKHGHNEQDEPSFTQPILADLIRHKSGVLSQYAEFLRTEGVITEKDVETIKERLLATLEAAQAEVKKKPHDPNIDPGSRRWQGYSGKYSFEPTPTGVSMDLLKEACDAFARVPEGFNVNPKLRRLLEDRAALPSKPDEVALSYADAESLAFGTLLLEGHGIRLSGQDVRRGTFSHRHAVLRDTKTGEAYVPLNNMRTLADSVEDAGKPGPDGRPMQGQFNVYDSPLSEMAVLAFDYGYSLSDPRQLVCWEAQFGDFGNGAQVIIDQFISSAELKWERWSGLVLLLPHGYEGAGPEHSSARLERFLQLCGNDNMQVVYPSTAAQCFHMFRRQMKRGFRKPLIVMTPKSMLRVPTGSVRQLLSGHFQDVLDDPRFETGGDRKAVTRVLLCSGKIYHELAARRDAAGRGDTAIVRLEQLYPFNAALLKEVLERYPKAKEHVWVQEEPRNMGAFHFVDDAVRTRLGLSLSYIGRDTSASPAVGSKHKHKEQQEQILVRALGEQTPANGTKSAAAAAMSAPAAGKGAQNQGDRSSHAPIEHKPNGAPKKISSKA